MSDERFKGAEGLIDFSINSVIKAAPEGGDEDDIIIEGMANTTTVDRAGDLIPRSTWEKESQLSNYRKNPIVLAYHNHSMPIGVVESLEVKDEGLFVRVRISNTIPAVFQQITPKKQNTQIAPVEPEIVKLARQLGCLRKSVK